MLKGLLYRSSYLLFYYILLYSQIAGESLNMAFVDQVIHYHIKTSLFDIVVSITLSFVHRDFNNKMTTIRHYFSLFIGSRDFMDFIFSDGSDLQVYGLVALLCAAVHQSLDYRSSKYIYQFEFENLSA